MAPSTACSASLLHGAWRPANSRSGEETAGDADVIPGRLLPIGVPEQGGRMVRNDNRDAPKPGELVTERAQRLLGVEQRLRRGAGAPQRGQRAEGGGGGERVGGEQVAAGGTEGAARGGKRGRLLGTPGFGFPGAGPRARARGQWVGPCGSN